MRSQLGLLRRGRLMSNGQGGGVVPPPAVFPPPPILPPGVPAPPPPATVVFESAFVNSTNQRPTHHVIEFPPAWAGSPTPLGIELVTTYTVGGVLIPDAFLARSLPLGSTLPQDFAILLGPGFVPGGVLRTSLVIVGGTAEAPLTVYWAWSGLLDYDALTPVIADNDPDDAEALVAVLDELVTHATFDAWVQDHEAFLPERPDNWTTMNLASKRAWVTANYDFAAVEPDAEGVAHNTAGADDTAGAEDGADETGADEGTDNTDD